MVNSGLGRRRRRTVIGAATTLLLLALLVWWVNPRQVIAALQACNLRMLAYAAALTPIVIGIKVARWTLLARSLEPNFPVATAIRSYLAGLFLATVTPLAAGEAARSLFVTSDKRAQLTGKTILEKLVDLASLSLFGGIGLFVVGTSLQLAAGIVACLGFVAFCAIVFFIAPRFSGQVEALAAAGGIKSKIGRVLDGIVHTGHGQLTANILLACCGFIVYFTQGLLVLQAFAPDCPARVMVFLPIITLSTILPIGIGGIGVREGTAVLLLAQFGLTQAEAFNGTLAHFTIVQIIPATIGAFFISRSPREVAP